MRPMSKYIVLGLGGAEASLHVLADAFSALAELRMMGHKSSELPGAVSISYHEDMLLLSSKGNAHATNKTEACLTMRTSRRPK